MPDLSVIICTHNPRTDYLRRVLEALKTQILPKDRGELLLIDNASKEPLAENWDLSWHPQARHVREEELGLTPARLRGIREAQGELLVFVDDDNVLDPDYLAQALAIARDYPLLGAWSGQCRPEFEQEPPAWTRRYWGNLCIREFQRDVWSNLPHLPETGPCGAGLCVRRAVAQHYLRLHESGQRKLMLDRVGNSTTSGGDSDLAASATDLGLGGGLFARLRLTHLIPPERLTEEYLLRLVEGIYFSGIMFRSFRDSQGAATEPSWRRRVADWVRLALLPRRDRLIQRAALRGAARARALLGNGHQE